MINSGSCRLPKLPKTALPENVIYACLFVKYKLYYDK